MYQSHVPGYSEPTISKYQLTTPKYREIKTQKYLKKKKPLLVLGSISVYWLNLPMLSSKASYQMVDRKFVEQNQNLSSQNAPSYVIDYAITYPYDQSGMIRVNGSPEIL